VGSADGAAAHHAEATLLEVERELLRDRVAHVAADDHATWTRRPLLLCHGGDGTTSTRVDPRPVGGRRSRPRDRRPGLPCLGPRTGGQGHRGGAAVPGGAGGDCGSEHGAGAERERRGRWPAATVTRVPKVGSGVGTRPREGSAESGPTLGAHHASLSPMLVIGGASG